LPSHSSIRDETDDESELAEQLLSGVSIRASRINAQIAAIVRDAGRLVGWEDRAAHLRIEISIAGLSSVETTLLTVHRDRRQRRPAGGADLGVGAFDQVGAVHGVQGIAV
jgi:hypothetical protein